MESEIRGRWRGRFRRHRFANGHSGLQRSQQLHSWRDDQWIIIIFLLFFFIFTKEDTTCRRRDRGWNRRSSSTYHQQIIKKTMTRTVATMSMNARGHGEKQGTWSHCVPFLTHTLITLWYQRWRYVEWIYAVVVMLIRHEWTDFLVVVVVVVVVMP